MHTTVITNSAPCCAVFYDKEKDAVTTYPVAGWIINPLIAAPHGLVRAAAHTEEGAFAFITDEGWTPSEMQMRALLIRLRAA